MKTRPSIPPAFALAALTTVATGCAAEEAEERRTDRPPLTLPPSASTDLEPVPPSSLCVTAGRVDEVGDSTVNVPVAAMRGYIEGDRSRSVEIVFRYGGPSRESAPLASGEMRRQIGLKLRAEDACNVVYVMWRLSDAPGVFTSVKVNPGMKTHEECFDHGYVNVRPDAAYPTPRLDDGRWHTLRADLEGDELRVSADGALAWRGRLPAVAFTIDGPAGVRTDNGDFDFELRVPRAARARASCAPAAPRLALD
jgi:hypothetical protein